MDPGGLKTRRPAPRPRRGVENEQRSCGLCWGHLRGREGRQACLSWLQRQMPGWGRWGPGRVGRRLAPADSQGLTRVMAAWSSLSTCSSSEADLARPLQSLPRGLSFLVMGDAFCRFTEEEWAEPQDPGCPSPGPRPQPPRGPSRDPAAPPSSSLVGHPAPPGEPPPLPVSLGPATPLDLPEPLSEALLRESPRPPPLRALQRCGRTCPSGGRVIQRRAAAPRPCPHVVPAARLLRTPSRDARAGVQAVPCAPLRAPARGAASHLGSMVFLT